MFKVTYRSLIVLNVLILIAEQVYTFGVIAAFEVNKSLTYAVSEVIVFLFVVLVVFLSETSFCFPRFV